MPEPADGRELYIYYRVTEGDALPASQAVRQMQAALQATNSGLQARLLRRPEAPQGLATFMEVYAAPGGLSARVQADIEQAATALAPWLRGERHTEVFLPCA